MNPETVPNTAETQPVTTDEKAPKATPPERQPQPPKKNCRKCYGRGYVGHNFHTKEPVRCSCTWDIATRRAWNQQQDIARQCGRR